MSTAQPIAPAQATFVVGKDRHGRPVEVIYRDGEFDLVRQAANQQDDTQAIRGLTRDNLVAIGSVATMLKDWPAK